ncbi:hypothetical protein [Roseisolibacter agri]|nr:hypothetical protein [Roseisolibacter agri]
MMLTRLAATPPLRADAPPAGIARALADLVDAPHRALAHAAGPWLAPPLSPRLVTPPALLALVRALSGRMIVTNPTAVVRLPLAVGLLARAALQRALAPSVAPPAESPSTESVEDARDVRVRAARRRVAALEARLPAATAALAPGARWATVILYEPTTLTVHLAREGVARREPEPLQAHAVLRYRLALVVGRADALPTDALPTDALPTDALPTDALPTDALPTDALPTDALPTDAAIDAAAAAAPATAWPPGRGGDTPWFLRRLLIPDAQAAAHMDDGTLARWGTVTGRGMPRHDSYWFSESWERFREPGRHVGYVAPDYVARARRLPSAGGPSTSLVAPALDATVERGVCVPPGYCLVDCVGTLEVAVVAC